MRHTYDAKAAMRHLIIGAGATFAQALEFGIKPENGPPLMRDFARKTWANYSPYPLLERYLNELGITNLGHDPREKFYELEEIGKTNIELFMEYCWVNRHSVLTNLQGPYPPGFISGLRISQSGEIEAPPIEGEEFWENLLYHGIGSPIQTMMILCFAENRGAWKEFKLTKTIATALKASDLVLNLNYDTVFELTLEQLGRTFKYAPNVTENGEIVICKPHGSLNMVANAQGFTFGQPGWLGMPQPSGYRSYSGLIPPRMNKNFDQHPISRMIVQSVENRKPQELIFWGVGLTKSDIDLLNLYKRWAVHAEKILFINPDPNVSKNAAKLLNCKVQNHEGATNWIESIA